MNRSPMNHSTPGRPAQPAPSAAGKPARGRATSGFAGSRWRSGFTLIELIMVMAVIAILALIAMPSFTEKMVRDQIVEGAKLADLAKGPVGASWALAKKMPLDNAEAGLPVPDKIVNNLVSSVTVQSGAIHVRFGNNAHGAIKGKVLTLRPAVVEDTPMVPVTWLCSQAKVPDKMVVKGVDNTDIDKKFLPRNCL